MNKISEGEGSGKKYISGDTGQNSFKFDENYKPTYPSLKELQAE